jgi:hypothetical protein
MSTTHPLPSPPPAPSPPLPTPSTFITSIQDPKGKGRGTDLVSSGKGTSGFSSDEIKSCMMISEALCQALNSSEGDKFSVANPDKFNGAKPEKLEMFKAQC